MVLLVDKCHAAAFQLSLTFGKVGQRLQHLVIYLLGTFSGNVHVKRPLYLSIDNGHCSTKVFLVFVGLLFLFSLLFYDVFLRLFPYILGDGSHRQCQQHDCN